MLIVLLLLGLMTPGRASRAVPLAHFGVAGRGNDDTKVIQAALDATAARGQTLEIPASPIPYRVRPLKIPSGTKLVLDAGAFVQAVPGYGPYDTLLEVANISDVSIKGTPGKSIFKMRRSEYTTGEYRHCLNIVGSSHISVTGIACNDSGGDGLYIGPGRKGFSDHVTVSDSSFENNSRNGFSLTSGSDLLIRRCRFANRNGTGVDIEPNAPENRIANVRIQDCAWAGNRQAGISLGLYALKSRTLPVSVTIERCKSRGNGWSGFFASGNDAPDGPAGSVTVSDCSSTGDAEYGAVASFWVAPGPMLLFRNLTVTDANGSGKTYDNAAIAVKRGGGGVAALGNVRITGTSIIDTKHRLQTYFSVRDYSKVGFKNIRIDAFRTLKGLPKGAPLGLLDGKPVRSVEIPP